MKFKELRGFIIACVLLLIDIGLLLFSFQQQSKTKIILCLILFLFILSTFLTQYFVRVYEDFIYIYIFAGIGLLPKAIDYSDIEVIILISKRKIAITTKNKKIYHVYVFNSTKLIICLKDKNKNLNIER